MRVSYKWICEVVDLPASMTPEKLGEALTNCGIPVEEFEPLTPGIEGVVVARVLDVVKHPNADKLRVCSVDAGEAGILQIVCGAANVAPGISVPCAKIGAVVYDRHSGEKMSIKKSKLRGVESQGMLCSADELGLDVKLLPKGAAEGLLILPADAPVGQDVVAYMGLDDVSMELELTPNRSDCLSLRGIAHEIAAVLKVRNKFYEVSSGGALTELPSGNRLQVEILSDACSSYYAQVITDIQVGPSPLWLQMRLAAQGVRSINNVVDITNLVMFEWGQPLHAFDYEQIHGGLIRVRYAEPGEQLVTLDGQTRTLSDSMQVIADRDRAVGIAGVMGGENSEVREKTTTIVLESAYFDPRVTRRTGKALGLSSEAQKRFEKGIDPAAVSLALERAVSLLQELAGGKVCARPVATQTEEAADSVQLSLDTARMNRVLGTRIGDQDVLTILETLEFETVSGYDQKLSVKVPTRRPDIQLEEDLYEEVARLYGYDAIPSTLPQGGISQGFLSAEQALRRRLRHMGAALGLSEVWTYTFSHPKWIDEMHAGLDSPLRRQIQLLSPLSEERQVLRTTMLPPLVEVLQHNLRRKQLDVAIFEIGKTYHKAEDQEGAGLPEEPWILAMALTGNLLAKGPLNPPAAVDFFTVKGMIETILDRLGIQGVRYIRASHPWMHPGRSALIMQNGQELGYLGALHPEVAETWELPDTYYAELRLAALLDQANTELAVKPLPKFPAIERDLALLMDRETPVGEVMETLRETGGSWLESVSLFDVYQGPQVPEDKKSAAFSLVYRDPERTLTDEEVGAVHEKIVAAISSRFEAELRR